MEIRSLVPALLMLVAPLLLAAGASAQNALDPARVAEIAGWLGPEPFAFGRPIDDRAFWDSLARREAFARPIKDAEALLGQPLPDQPAELYLEFFRTGNRTRWQNVAGQRRGRVSRLALAECLENQGRFIAALEEVLRALCAEPTWVMPAHDANHANFDGKSVDIDLGSSMLAWDLATALWLLGDHLAPDVRELVVTRCRERIFEPYRDMVEGKRRVNWWLLTTNNWNAVCLGGVTGTALALLPSREERAFFVAAAEHYSKNFLKGFTADGYCSEGVGYWDYGFGYFVLLAEAICQATGGRVDLFDDPAVRAPAAYGARIEILNGVSPAFADCAVTARPSSSILWFVNRRYGLGLRAVDSLDVAVPRGSLYETLMYAAPNSAGGREPAAAETSKPEARTWFDQAGIYIGRPGAYERCAMGVAWKGGHNNEHHNHNDVGSYVVVVGRRPVLLDPGAEVYTARTFSSRRYESRLLNSYGHPVPVVAGQLQRTGREAQGKVLRTEFGEEADTMVFDLTSAYDVPDLKRLERAFVYDRRDAGSLTVTDTVEYATPQAFGTAILTAGEWTAQEDGSLFVSDGDGAVRVEVTSSVPYTLRAERIEENAPVHPVRLGFDLNEPVTTAWIAVQITAVPTPGLGPDGLLPNGSFEQGGWCWSFGDRGMSRISDERAATGRYSLKIVDASDKDGSSADSARIPIDGPGKFELRGKVYHESGRGVGLYVRFFDAAGNLLNVLDERGWLSAIGVAAGPEGQWASFALPFEAPPDTVAVQVWIHSASNAVVTAYLDDLAIVRLPE